MRNIYLYILLFAFLPLKNSFAQERTKRVADTIRYEFIQNKIIIPVTVNGVKTKYILDTGGKTGTLRTLAVEMGAKSAGNSHAVSDLNSIATNYPLAILQNLELSPNYRLQSLETMIFPPQPFYTGLGVAGILGGDAFAQSVLTIDFQKQIIVINYPYRPEGLKITDGVEMFQGSNNHSIIDLRIGGINNRFLFDTGAHDLLMLSTSDYNKLKNSTKIDLIFTAHGINGIGIGGLGEPVEFYRLNVPELDFLGKKFTNVPTTTTNMALSIIGVELLEYGKVIIDYMRSRFYFFPYNDNIEELNRDNKTWNIAILPVVDHFEVTTIWNSAKHKFKYGDIVININGTDLKDFPLNQLEVEAVMNNIESDTAYVIILENGKEKRVEIHRE